MSSAADLGGIFIIIDVTALAFEEIINVRETAHWGTNWIVLSSEKATGQASLTFSHALKTFTRDEVMIRFRLTQDRNPD